HRNWAQTSTLKHTSDLRIIYTSFFAQGFIRCRISVVLYGHDGYFSALPIDELLLPSQQQIFARYCGILLCFHSCPIVYPAFCTLLFWSISELFFTRQPIYFHTQHIGDVHRHSTSIFTTRTIKQIARLGARLSIKFLFKRIKRDRKPPLFGHTGHRMVADYGVIG